jgi:hypothetical protein
MGKFRINLIGGGFGHCNSSSGEMFPKYVEWGKDVRSSNISMYVDDAILSPVDKTKKNYAWIAESSEYIAPTISRIIQNIKYMEDNFELIFTHDKRLLSLSNKMRLVITNAVPWIIEPKIYDKSKLASMIVSNKSSTSGHRYRLTALNKVRDRIDCFGAGWNRIEKKEQGLADYFFSIAMENGNYPNYFTEKVTDCFATGTIPVFWGTLTISEFFNEKGIIFYTDDFKIEDLSPELYYSKMDYIKDNFDRILQFPVAEDYIYENYIK